MPAWFTPLWLALDALAAFRITRLLTRDSLPPLRKLRETVLDRSGGSPWAVIVECPWCMGFWVACGVIATHAAIPGLWPWASAPLALSAVIGLLGEWEDKA